MNISDLDGNTIKWKIDGTPINDGRQGKSQYHNEVRLLLKDVYPTLHILEEVSIPIRRSTTYFLDFYIPLRKLAIEVHGQQHFLFNSHFFKTKLDFLTAQKRDKEKALWCEINNINFVVLHKDNYNEWRKLVGGR